MDNTTVSAVFEVRSERLSWFKDKMAKLAKRAAKMGLEAPTYSVGEMFSVQKMHPLSGAKYFLHFYPVTVSGQAPKYAGWTIIATLATLEGGEVIVRSITDTAIPTRFRDPANSKNCDHCKVARRRLETFVVVSDAGEYRQVGRQCIADFLGHKSPETLAAMAGFVAEARALAEAGGSSNEEGSLAVDYYLGFVSAAMTAFGWLSRSKARQEGAGVEPTADIAFNHAEFKPNFERELKRRGEERLEVTDRDVARATAAMEWATELSDSEVEASDYLYNLRTIVRAGSVEPKTAGYAASVIIAYEKATDQLRKAAEKPVSNYVGTVGERRLFDVVVERVIESSSDFGVTFIYMMTDKDGNDIKWFASHLLRDADSRVVEQGKSVTIKATVKRHQEYKGRKQTAVNRAEVFVERPKNTKKNQKIAQALVDIFAAFAQA